MDKRIIPDSTFFSFFLHNIEEPKALEKIANHFYVEVPPKVHNEIRNCKFYHHLKSFENKLHIFKEEASSFSEILKPLFSESQKEKGEHDIIVVGICYHSMGLDFLIVIDDSPARKFAKRNFPFLEEHLVWTANFIQDCNIKFGIFNKPETLDLLIKMKNSSKELEGFRITDEILDPIISEVENGRH